MKAALHKLGAEEPEEEIQAKEQYYKGTFSRYELHSSSVEVVRKCY
jgi:hypothetical protein